MLPITFRFETNYNQPYNHTINKPFVNIFKTFESLI